MFINTHANKLWKRHIQGDCIDGKHPVQTAFTFRQEEEILIRLNICCFSALFAPFRSFVCLLGLLLASPIRFYDAILFVLLLNNPTCEQYGQRERNNIDIIFFHCKHRGGYHTTHIHICGAFESVLREDIQTINTFFELENMCSIVQWTKCEKARSKIFKNVLFFLQYNLVLLRLTCCPQVRSSFTHLFFFFFIISLAQRLLLFVVLFVYLWLNYRRRISPSLYVYKGVIKGVGWEHVYALCGKNRCDAPVSMWMRDSLKFASNSFCMVSDNIHMHAAVIDNVISYMTS